MQEELYHYGVKGMRWGFRRSRQTLSNKVGKLERKNQKLSDYHKATTDAARKYASKSTSINTGNARYERRLTKATGKKAKYDLKLQKQLKKRSPNADKVAKYTAKSAKYNNRIMKAQKKMKYNKWQVKYEQAQADAAAAKAKIEKNARLMNMYNKTIKGLDEGKIKQGRMFMQYVKD